MCGLRVHSRQYPYPGTQGGVGPHKLIEVPNTFVAALLAKKPPKKRARRRGPGPPETQPKPPHISQGRRQKPLDNSTMSFRLFLVLRSYEQGVGRLRSPFKLGFESHPGSPSEWRGVARMGLRNFEVPPLQGTGISSKTMSARRTTSVRLPPGRGS